MVTKKKTRKVVVKKVTEYKGVSKFVSVAPTKEQIENDVYRSNRATKFSLVAVPKRYTKVKVPKITTKIPKLR